MLLEQACTNNYYYTCKAVKDIWMVDPVSVVEPIACIGILKEGLVALFQVNDVLIVDTFCQELVETVHLCHQRALVECLTPANQPTI